MVHKWLLRKGFRRILCGIIIVLLGVIMLAIAYPYPIIEKRFSANPQIYVRLFLSDIDSVLIMFGVAVLLIGFTYSLATTILEYMRKRRHAHRSKI